MSDKKKKPKKFSELSAAELQTKRAELVKAELSFRLSLDATHLQSLGGPGAVRQDLRRVARLQAVAGNKAQAQGNAK